MNELDVGEKIALIWCFSDVLWRAQHIGISISEAQAKIVLASLKRNHDANHGVSWETIDVYLYDLERECEANKDIRYAGVSDED